MNKPGDYTGLPAHWSLSERYNEADQISLLTRTVFNLFSPDTKEEWTPKSSEN